jgi:DNA polymerase III subunit epsilon
MKRQIVLDTETTGLEVTQGNRVIEIGCIELKNRRPTQNHFHRYVNPERASEPGAEAVHGITSAFLADKPKFAEIARALWDYLEGAELLIHNAPFDLGFLNAEFARAGFAQKLEDVCTITDTVTLARKLHPGQKNRLDDLCKRYNVDNSQREFHGALLDAHLLAQVYLAMTGGQSALLLDSGADGGGTRRSRFVEAIGSSDGPLMVVRATAEEIEAHEARLQKISEKAPLLWPAKT